MLSHTVNGREIGSGKGFSITLAKKEAAVRALSTLRSNGI
jgi:dsRNA-specific ribonuclease